MLLEDNQIYAEDPVSDFIAKAGLRTGMTQFAKSVQQKADIVQENVETKVKNVKETVKDAHNKIKERASALNPKVGIPFPAYDPWPDTQNLFYGFANGVVDVFPYESLPSRCRGNIT